MLRSGTSSPHRLCSLLVLTVLTGGCAIHAPMSESVMFGRSKPNDSVIGGLGINFTVIPAGWEAIQSEAEARHHSNSDTVVEPANLRKQGIAVQPLWLFPDRTAAVSLSFGLMFGADATVKVPADFYVTLTGTINGGYEAVLQRRVYENRYFGVALGPAFRSEDHAYDTYGADFGPAGWFGPSMHFTEHSLGLRMSAIVLDPNEKSLFLRSILFTGYSPTHGSGVLRFGLTLGAY